MSLKLTPDSVLDRTTVRPKRKTGSANSPAQVKHIGEMAVGLAHEIREPITGIKGALEVFQRELDLSKEDRAVFEEILFQVRKLDLVTKSFLEYAHICGLNHTS